MRRIGRTSRAVMLLAGACVGALALGGCAGPADAPLGEQDRAALAQLAEIAGPSSGIATETITGTECWLPSRHRIAASRPADTGASAGPGTAAGADATGWRVLCRVHWIAADGAERHQDTTCIGDFAAQPMLDRCYRWTHYDQMPAFEDAPAVDVG